jgi:hypothetical protein
LDKLKQDLINLPKKNYIKASRFNGTIPVHFLNLMLVQIFPNLTRLEFNRAKVPFKTLLVIFGKLNKLEHLVLCFVYIVRYRRENYTARDLIFPESLISLNFGELGLATSQYKKYPRVLNYNNIQDFEDIIGIGIHPQTLPNLKNLIYNPKLSAAPANIQLFLNFLSLNKLESLNTLPKFLAPEIIKELTKNNILKHLKLGLFSRNSDILGAPMIKVNSITKLSMYLNFKTRDYLNQNNCLFPQVTHLELISRSPNSFLLEAILLNFPKLTRLTLKSIKKLHTGVFKRLNLPLLREVNLFSIRYSLYMSSDFDNLRSLERVTIEWRHLGFNSGLRHNRYLSNKLDNWICFTTGNRAHYYKK